MLFLAELGLMALTNAWLLQGAHLSNSLAGKHLGYFYKQPAPDPCTFASVRKECIWAWHLLRQFVTPDTTSTLGVMVWMPLTHLEGNCSYSDVLPFE